VAVNHAAEAFAGSDPALATSVKKFTVRRLRDERRTYMACNYAAPFFFDPLCVIMMPTGDGCR